jgi:hypothetical protein
MPLIVKFIIAKIVIYWVIYKGAKAWREGMEAGLNDRSG